MKPITILFVHSSDEMYGADVVLLKLLDNIDKARFRPIIVIPNDISYQGLLTKALAERNIKTYHLKTAILRRKYFNPIGLSVYLYRLFISTFKLILLIKRESVDIVHTNTLAVIPGALAAFLTNKPNIWHVHEIITSPRLLWKFTSWLTPRLSRQVVAVSGPTRDHLCKGNGLNEKKAVVIHNGIDVNQFKQPNPARAQVRGELGALPGNVLIGMIGRFSSWKGQDYFVEVASLVSKMHSNVHFVMVGGTFPGQEDLVEKIRDLIKQRGLSQQTTISPFRSDIPAVLNGFDIFVLPSTLPDPLPTVVLEAMAAGKPVVANAHGGSLEMVVNGETGFLVMPGKPELMAQAISRLISNSEERTKMGTSGRDRLIKEFSLETYVSKWSQLYSCTVQEWT